MKIDQLVLGDYQTNCYVVSSDGQASDCVIIDAGLDAGPLVEFLNESKLTPVAVLLTHGHADHIAGLAELRTNWPAIKVYIHELDADSLMNSIYNLSKLAGKEFSTDPADELLKDGDEVDIVGVKLSVIHTPGHTPGGICLYSQAEKLIFVGDTLFADSIGRTDFPGGNGPTLIASIKEKLFPLPDDTDCLTGHGAGTVLGTEKKSNPFLR